MELGVDRPVAPLEPLLAQLDEVVEGVAVVRDRELRKQDRPELDLDRAALRDLERAAERLRVPGSRAPSRRALK